MKPRWPGWSDILGIPALLWKLPAITIRMFVIAIVSLRFPLLQRELIEQSARKRTYWLRVAFLALLAIPTLIVWLETRDRAGVAAGGAGTVISMLGEGRQMMEVIFVMIYMSLFVFLPPMMAAAVTSEKERNTLGLLLITKLGPWKLLLEKLLSRILPMLSLVCLSLPLLMLAYSFGGVTLAMLLNGVVVLVLTILLIGSVGLLMSVYFRGIVAATLWTYAALFGMFVIPGIVYDLAHHDISFGSGRGLRFVYDLVGTSLAWLFRVHPNEFPSALFNAPYHAPAVVLITQFGMSRLGVILATLFPTVLTIVLSLSLARLLFWRRAFAEASNPLLWAFRVLDSRFKALNDRFGRGLILIRDAAEVPGTAPIQWRELSKRSLGQSRYLFRLLLALELPVVLCILWIMTSGTSSVDAITMVTVLSWIITLALLASIGSTLIAGERSRQTMEVLLTTPLSGTDIVLQKLSGAQRLMWACALPLITCHLFHIGWMEWVVAPMQQYQPQYRYYTTQNYNTWEYLLGMLSLLVLYLPLTLWVSIYVGLRMQTTARAWLTTLAVIVGWCVIPPMLLMICGMLLNTNGVDFDDLQNSGLMLTMLGSPMMLFLFNEFHDLRVLFPMPMISLALNTVLYAVVLYRLRSYCLRNADRLLGRMNSTPHPELILKPPLVSSVPLQLASGET